VTTDDYPQCPASGTWRREYRTALKGRARQEAPSSVGLRGWGRRQHAFDPRLDRLALGPEPGIPSFEEPATERLAQLRRHLGDLLAQLLSLLFLGVRDLDDLDGPAERPIRKPRRRLHSISQGDPALPQELPISAEHSDEELDQVLAVAHGLPGESGEAQRSATGVPAGVVTGGEGAAWWQFRCRSVRAIAVLVAHHQHRPYLASFTILAPCSSSPYISPTVKWNGNSIPGKPGQQTSHIFVSPSTMTGGWDALLAETPEKREGGSESSTQSLPDIS
jgi:hypothetical protein